MHYLNGARSLSNTLQYLTHNRNGPFTNLIHKFKNATNLLEILPCFHGNTKVHRFVLTNYSTGQGQLSLKFGDIIFVLFKLVEIARKLVG